MRRRHGRLRLHGRGPLAGVAHGGPLLRPAARGRLAVLCGRDAAAAAAAAPNGWAGGASRPTGGGWSTRDDVDLVDVCTPGDTPRRDRDRRAGGRQARAVREAAGQHGGRGRGDGGRGRARRAARGRAQRWSGSTTGGCRRWRWPGGWSPTGGSATIRHVRAQYLQDWIVDPAVPAGLAAAAGPGRVGRAGRHRRAHRRPAQFVTGDRIAGRQRADRDVRPASARCPRSASGLSATGGDETRRGHRGRRRAVPRPVRRRRAGAASRRPGSPPAARTRSGWRSTAARAAWRSTSRR